MDHYKETAALYDRMAIQYEQRFMNFDLYNDTYSHFCAQIQKKDAAILEIGCGPGNITKNILAERPDFKVFGIDIAPNMIALAAKNNPTAQFQVMDCREISNLTTVFDGIIAGFCVPYLSAEDCARMIADASNLLTANGVLYLSFVDDDYQKSGYQISTTGEKYHFFFHEAKKLRKQLLQNEFKVIKTFDKDYLMNDKPSVHKIIIAQKQ